ncbi:hypothetical protein [Photobacterium damselae]|uniref:hypothetical protein n=1 Tax=Photobacterium damselae TaxID=38293 RepID=UPI001F354971|nr:hypothetical protein [Photobacterium damselae]UKA04662.1 hypothetical protein IHC89_23880 [Photobacterium damselae subsp. damselae]
MNIQQILETEEFFTQEDASNYYYCKPKFFANLSKQRDTLDKIYDVIDEDVRFPFLMELSRYQNTHLVNIGGGTLYLHLSVIPVTQFNFAIAEDNPICLKNQIINETTDAIRKLLESRSITYKFIPFFLPMSLVCSDGQKLISPITEAIKRDLEDIDLINGDLTYRNKHALSVLDEIGVDDSWLFFDSNIINNNIILLYSLSDNETPPVFTFDNMQLFEDALAHQYKPFVDGYKCIVHKPAPLEYLSFLDVASTICANIEKYDIDNPFLYFEFDSKKDRVTVHCSIYDNLDHDRLLMAIKFEIKNSLFLSHSTIEDEITRVALSLNRDIVVS